MLAAGAIPRVHDADKPVLGLILPPAGRPVPEEALAMYGGQVRFQVAGLGVESMTPASFDAALSRIPVVARQLADAGARAIGLMGTSLTFYKGEAFNQELRESLARASGLPATTMSNGVIEAMKVLGVRRLAVATAYNDVVNDRLRAFLHEHGFDPLVITGMGIEAMNDVERVTGQDLEDFAARVHASAPGAEALLVSCGGLRTLEIIAPLEARTGVPVVSSFPHGLWAVARLAGLDGRVADHGHVLAI